MARSSSRAIRGRSVFDPKNDHESMRLVDLVDHAVGATPGRPESGEFALEFVAETVWIVDERAEHELDDRRGGAFGESIELSFGLVW